MVTTKRTVKFSNFHLGLGSSSDESECACATKFVSVFVSPMKRKRSCVAEDRGDRKNNDANRNGKKERKKERKKDER